VRLPDLFAFLHAARRPIFSSYHTTSIPTADTFTRCSLPRREKMCRESASAQCTGIKTLALARSRSLAPARSLARSLAVAPAPALSVALAPARSLTPRSAGLTTIASLPLLPFHVRPRARDRRRGGHLAGASRKSS
jgi:hypothetical protein